MKKHFTLLSALALTTCMGISAQQVNNMVVQANKVGAEIQPTMYGHFFEDINYGADGGLYAELIKNRSFEFPQNFMGWNVFGNVTLLDDGPFDKNPHYVRLGDPGHAHKRTGIENEGSQVITSQTLDINSKDWKKYEIKLTPKETFAKAHLRIFLASAGTVDLEHVSLFPTDTWKGRENGLRKDLVQALADTKPGIFRFPGGCIVEGTDLATRYNWKNSVGPGREPSIEREPLALYFHPPFLP